MAFPIDFAIPRDSSATSDENPENRVLWRLEAYGDLPGVDYRTVIEVPVFETGASEVEEQEPSRFAGARDRGEPGPGPGKTRIQTHEDAHGGYEFRFPAARNPSVAVGLTVFSGIFGGATVAMLLRVINAPDRFGFFNLFFALFPVVFGFASLILVVVTIDAWLGRTTVVIEQGHLRSRHTVFGIGSSSQIACDEIDEIGITIGMQQQQTITQSAKAYYDIRVVPKVGRPFKAGGGIRSKREAEWWAEQMWDAAKAESP